MPEIRKENDMKKLTLLGIIFIAALIIFSGAPAVFAGNSTHTITIVNNSDTPLKPARDPHKAHYDSYNSACNTVPPDSCGEVDLPVPDQIAAHSSGTINMTGPTGCNISSWQAYWTLNLKGKNGVVKCWKSPVNVCNSVNKNYTCTISQSNVNAVKGNGNYVAASSIQ